MITVSTSQAAERAYHHGDLRSSLLSEGIALVENDGIEALSLREVARRAGVSATAVYRHFPDKAALTAALAAEAMRRLGVAQRDAAQAAGGGRAGFTATGRAYVRFALANPGLFRLTYACPATAHHGLSHGGLPADLLMANARMQCSGNEAEAQRLSLQAWSVSHGLAMLMLDGRIPAEEAIIDSVIDAGALFQT
jgi:AcrR family transcriptional regulator